MSDRLSPSDRRALASLVLGTKQLGRVPGIGARDVIFLESRGLIRCTKYVAAPTGANSKWWDNEYELTPEGSEEIARALKK